MRNLVLFLSFCWLFVLKGNSQNTTLSPEVRIVGGSQAVLGEIPWQGLLRTSSRTLCGCSLISTRWAATAAHCTYGIHASRIFLHFGIIDRVKKPNTQSFDVIEKIEHPGYRSGSFDFDISLLRLSSSVEENFAAKKISLPPPGVLVTVGKTCLISGWGTESAGSDELPDILKVAEVPIWSNSDCQRAVGRNIRNDQLCAGLRTGGVDTCQGDSGGPLACYNEELNEFLLQGITSFGFGCAEYLSPGIYTRVSSFSEWINEVTDISSANRVEMLRLQLILTIIFTFLNL